MIINRVLVKITATKTYPRASRAARMRYHLLINPAPGGIPIIASAARIMARLV